MGFAGKVWKTGNVLVITIPKKECEAYNIQEHDYVDVEINKIEKPKKINR